MSPDFFLSEFLGRALVTLRRDVGFQNFAFERRFRIV